MNLLERIKNYFKKEKIEEIENKYLSLNNNNNVIEKIIKKSIYNPNLGNITIILNNDNILEGNITENEYEIIKNCVTELEIINILKKVNDDAELKINVGNMYAILNNTDDFNILNNKVYLKNIDNLSIPNEIVLEFIRILNELENTIDINGEFINESLHLSLNIEYKSLLMFTYWLFLNPIESSRNDALSFIKKNDIQLTENGLLLTYRKVVSRNNSNKKLVNFISESYFKIKKWRKSPLNYNVFKNTDNDFILKSFTYVNDKFEKIGNLDYLYKNLSSFQDKSYTDNHTKTKDIKIGAIYKEDEDKIDIESRNECSFGIHTGSKQFLYNSFGDTGVLCLVNPMYIRSVPIADSNKMRVSELFIVCTLEKDKYDALNTYIDFSNEYSKETLETLKVQLKEKSLKMLNCQNNITNLSFNDILKLSKKVENQLNEVIW